MVIIYQVSEEMEEQAVLMLWLTCKLLSHRWGGQYKYSPLSALTGLYAPLQHTQIHNMTHSTEIKRFLWLLVCIYQNKFEGDCSLRYSYLLGCYCITSLFTQSILTCWEWSGCRRWVYPCRVTWLAVVKRNQIRVICFINPRLYTNLAAIQGLPSCWWQQLLNSHWACNWHVIITTCLH